MVKKILIGLILVIALIVGYAATRPAEYAVSRSLRMDAPRKVVFAQVNDLHKWEAWSPWAKMDPNAKNTFEGPAAGEGAKLSWDGNRKVGKGDMTILESRPPELVKINTHFEEPMEGTSLTEMTFAEADGGTLMTWKMSGTNNVMGRVMCLFMNMDKMVGGDFEKGLAGIKAIAEAQSKK